LRRARQIFAGIIGLWQGNLTQPGTKSGKKTGAWIFQTRPNIADADFGGQCRRKRRCVSEAFPQGQFTCPEDVK
jgi:hypothetical protein